MSNYRLIIAQMFYFHKGFSENQQYFKVSHSRTFEWYVNLMRTYQDEPPGIIRSREAFKLAPDIKLEIFTRSCQLKGFGKFA